MGFFDFMFLISAGLNLILYVIIQCEQMEIEDLKWRIELERIYRKELK